MRCVIVHREWGVYVGNCLGLGFFSLLDCAGQDCAVTFPSQAEAEAHINSWEPPSQPIENFQFYDVAPENPAYATPDELEVAGIPKEMIEPIKTEARQMREIEADEAKAHRLH